MNRSTIIDCLRALAVLSVIFYHYAEFRYGLYGVSLFFLISGYCILISAESSNSAWNFYAKRLSRLAPALLFCGGLTVFIKQIAPLIPERMANWNDYFSTLLALPTLNVLSIDFSWPDGAYWSLAIEFRFYALVFLLLILGGRGRVPHGIAVSSIIFTMLAVTKPDFSPLFTPYSPYFLAGIALKVAHVDRRIKFGLLLLGLSFCISFVHYFFGISEPSIPTSAESLIAFAVCIVVFYLILNYNVVEEKIDPKINSILKPLSFIGLVSYPLYLLHQDIGYWALVFLNNEFNIKNHVEIELIFRLIILPAFLLILAVMVYFFIEKPLIKMIARFLSGLPRNMVNTTSCVLSKAGMKPTEFMAKAGLVCFFGMSLMLALFGIRLIQHSNATMTIGVIEKAVEVKSPVNLNSAWGGIKIIDGYESRTIDIENIPPSSCPKILVEASNNQKVRRAAVSTRSVDEMPTPVSQFRAELACAGFKNRTIRVISRTPS